MAQRQKNRRNRKTEEETENIPSWLKDLLDRQEKSRKEEIESLHEILADALNQGTASGNNQRPNETRNEAKHPSPARPKLLDTDVSYSKFRIWRTSWEDYSKLQKLEQLPIDIQQADLRSCFTENMKMHIKCAIDITDSNSTVDNILDQIQEYLRKKRNITLDHVAFEERRQEDGEQFDDFYVDLKRIAEESELCGNCVEKRLTTKIISGVRCPELRQKLLILTPFPSLKEVVDICRSFETANKDSQSLENKIPIERIRNPATTNQDRSYNTQAKCGRCGYGPHKNSSCPAKNTVCKKCGKIGHWEKVCRSKESNIQEIEAEEIEPQQLRTLTIAGIKHCPTPTVDIVISSTKNDKSIQVRGIPDTGAEATVCGPDIIKALAINAKALKSTTTERLMAANGSPISTLGKIRLQLKVGHISTQEDVVICEKQSHFLLSWTLCQKLKLIPDDFPNQIRRVNIEETKKENIPINKTREKLIQEFSDVFSEECELKKMSGGNMKIHLKEDAVPYAIYAARPIPILWKDQVKEKLDKLIEQNIIKPIGDKTTDWCHPMVVVPKQNGGVRLCVDLTKLNKYVNRPTYPTTTPKDSVTNIPPTAKFFTTMDMSQGYFQLPLDEDSQELTTFMTPWGRFCFMRAPMGLTSTGDEFSRRGDEALQGIDNTRKVVDDILIYDDNFQEHIERVRNLLMRCREKNITLNREKFHLAQENVKYVGYNVGTEGISVNENKLKALAEFPRPRNLKDLRSFMGLVNHLGEFSSQISTLAHPLRSILKKKNAFVWTPHHTEAFEAVKKSLQSSPTLSHYDPSKKIILQTDASKLNGLGYLLLQEENGQKKLVQCGSRFLTPPETRYSVVELEMLAVVWAIKKCHLYLAGLPLFLIQTDHRSLITILNMKTLDEIDNMRIQRLKEKIMAYTFKSEWIKGKENIASDALSRSPVEQFTDEDKQLNTEIQYHVQEVIRLNVKEIYYHQDIPNEDPYTEEIRNEGQTDEEYKLLLDTITNGFPTEKSRLNPKLLHYWNLRQELSSNNQLILFNSRLLIPKRIRKKILSNLHAAHEGIEKTKKRARQTVFWPGLSTDIKNTIEACEKCQTLRPSQAKQPMFVDDDIPTRVFEIVSMDFFSYAGKNFLVYTDYFSGWPVIHYFKKGNATTKYVIRACRRNFSDLGIPRVIRTDGGLQFMSKEFQDFLKRFGVKHRPSTPYNPQSNGHAEASVKIIKNLVKKTTVNGNLDDDNFTKGLLEHRNTPNNTGYSPSQILYGHTLRSPVPAHFSAFDTKWHEIRKSIEMKQEFNSTTVARRYNEHSKELQNLKISQKVRIQDPLHKEWNLTGVIVGVGKYRDYLIKLNSGRTLWRNRKFLKAV